MNKEHLVPVAAFCIHYDIELSFVKELEEIGLLQIVSIDDEDYIHPIHLRNLERMTRMHYELDINIEGIEAINNLLDRISEMQAEIQTLRNKIHFYEGMK